MTSAIPTQSERERNEDKPLVEPLGKSFPPSKAEAPVDEELQFETPSDEKLDDLVRDPELRQELGSLRQLKSIIEEFMDSRSIIFVGETHIAGDLVARDQYRGAVAVSTAEPPFAAEHVLPEELAKVRAVYVPPPTYDRAQRMVIDQHLLILQGRPHIGKWTTALHLGAEALQARSVIELDPGLHLGELLKPDRLESRACYVTETLTPDSARELTDFLLRQLRKALRARESHLILCADPQVPLSRDALESHRVEWEEIPPAKEVLERHLQFYLTEDANALQAARELVESERIQAILGRTLLPGELDRLAELLAQVARDKLSLDQALSWFEARAETQVREWFDSHEDPEQLAFMITLAVFNGARYQEVMSAHKRLLGIAFSEAEQKAEALPSSPFASRRRHRLEACHAHLETAYEEREYGRTRVETVAFDNLAFQPAVLAYTWDEFDELRRPLLNWLFSFGDAPFDLRARAAVAVGELGKHDFATILDLVVRPWANSRTSRARDAAALALGMLAWSSDRTAEVRRLLNHWATLKDNWRLRWTAASAYGSLAGLRFPESALRNLFTIIADGDPRLLGVVSRSVAFLFQAGDAALEFFHKVLNTLLAWTGEKKRLTRLVSLLIFLDLASLREFQDETRGQENPWPWMLRLAHTDDELRAAITTLLRRALSEKLTRRLALETVKEWLKQADEDETLEPAITEVLRGIATEGDERERQRLRYYLHGWAHDRTSPLPVAAQVSRQIF